MRIDDKALDQFEFGAFRHKLVEQSQPVGKEPWEGYAALARGYPRAYNTGTVSVPLDRAGAAKVVVPTASIAVMLVRWSDTISREVRDGGVLMVAWDNLQWAITDREVFGRRKWLKLTLVSENLYPGGFDRSEREPFYPTSERERP